MCSEPAATQGVFGVCLPVPSSHCLLCPACVLGEGRAAGGPLIVVVVSLGSVGCIPCPPWGPACHASHAGLPWKAADSLGSALAEASAWLETLLILPQHRHSQAAQPHTHPIQMLLDEALWKMVGDLLEAALQTRAGDSSWPGNCLQ